MNDKETMKKILTGLLDMIVDLEKIVRSHDDRLDLITQAGRDQALGSRGVIEAMRGLLDSQEDQRDEIDALKNRVEFLTEDIRDLKTENRNLETENRALDAARDAHLEWIERLENRLDVLEDRRNDLEGLRKSGNEAEGE